MWSLTQRAAVLYQRRGHGALDSPTLLQDIHQRLLLCNASVDELLACSYKRFCSFFSSVPPMPLSRWTLYQCIMEAALGNHAPLVQNGHEMVMERTRHEEKESENVRDEQAQDLSDNLMSDEDAQRSSNIDSRRRRKGADQQLTPLSFNSYASLLNALTRGGVYNEVTEVVGPSACGKTQLMLQLAGVTACGASADSFRSASSASAAGNDASPLASSLPAFPIFPNRRVIFIDTCMSFSGDRLCEMHRHWSTNRTDSCQPAATMLSNIQVIETKSVFDLLAVIDKIRATLVEFPGSSFALELRLIIIDSVAALLSPIIGSSHGRGHALMAHVAFAMKSLAHRHHLAVVYTNNTVANRDRNATRDDVQPALGEFWTHVPDTRLIMLETIDSSSTNNDAAASSSSGAAERKATLQRKPLVIRLDKSCRASAGFEIRADIGSKGITDRAR